MVRVWRRVLARSARHAQPEASRQAEAGQKAERSRAARSRRCRRRRRRGRREGRRRARRRAEPGRARRAARRARVGLPPRSRSRRCAALAQHPAPPDVVGAPALRRPSQPGGARRGARRARDVSRSGRARRRRRRARTIRCGVVRGAAAAAAAAGPRPRGDRAAVRAARAAARSPRPARSRAIADADLARKIGDQLGKVPDAVARAVPRARCSSAPISVRTPRASRSCARSRRSPDPPAVAALDRLHRRDAEESAAPVARTRPRRSSKRGCRRWQVKRARSRSRSRSARGVRRPKAVFRLTSDDNDRGALDGGARAAPAARASRRR